MSDIGTPATEAGGLAALPLAAPGPSFLAPTRERTDAARNRARILEAAGRLFAQEGPEGVSMDAVARAAKVGKGTLYRRFGDRENLLLAIFSEREAAFQDELLHGPAPLGPGGTPEERLHAFAPAYLALLEQVGPIVAAVEERLPGARYRTGPYASYSLHLRVLLRQANAHCDAEWGAEALLALVRASHVMHLRRQGIDLDRIAHGWCVMVDALVRADRPA